MEQTAIRRTLAKALVLAGAMLLTATAWAQSPTVWTRAEVRKVDAGNGKITLKHEEIKSLEMPPMTMVFVVRDPASLEKFKVGDKVQFVVVREDGKMVITDIQPRE